MIEFVWGFVCGVCVTLVSLFVIVVYLRKFILSWVMQHYTKKFWGFMNEC